MIQSYKKKAIAFAMINLFASGFLLAQILDFKEAIVYTPDGPRTGVINLTNKVALSKFIRFKDEPKSPESVNYSPLEVDSFLLPGASVFYRTINHSYKSDSGIEVEEKRFGQRIFSGDKYSVFKVTMGVDEYEFLYAKLPDFVYYVYDHVLGTEHKLDIYEKTQGRTKFLVVRPYEGALKYLMQDWKQLDRKLKKLEYNDASMVGLFAEYHSSKGLKSVKEVVEQRRLKSFALHLGYVPVTLTQNVDHRYGALFAVKYTLLPKSKFFPDFQLGLDFMKMAYDLNGEESFSGIRNFEGFSQVRFSLGGRREFYRSLTGLSVYGRMELALGSRRYKNIIEKFDRIESADGSVQFVSRGTSREDLSTVTLAFNFGLGVRLKKYVFDAGFERIAYGTKNGSYVPIFRVGYEFLLNKE